MLNRELAGYEGELQLQYYLNFLTEKDYHLLHHIRLKDDNGYFQMDAILVTKFYILIMDSKYWTGHITIDNHFKQYIQLNKGVTQVYSDPVLQISLQEKRLKRWLKKMKYPTLPVKSLVVFTNRNVHLETQTPPNNYPFLNRVIKTPELIMKIDNFHHMYQMEILTNKELNKLTKTLCIKNVPEDPDYLSILDISPNIIIKGIRCEHCHMYAMKRYKGKWYCPHCKNRSSTAHHTTLQEYSFLYGNKITNKQLRNFLLIGSTSVAHKLLSSMDLPQTGPKQRTIYHLPIN
nr:nuclease-related domain-containing protein [Bacillus alkalicola]